MGINKTQGDNLSFLPGLNIFFSADNQCLYDEYTIGTMGI